jgi:hypothetical protein
MILAGLIHGMVEFVCAAASCAGKTSGGESFLGASLLGKTEFSTERIDY